MRRSDEFHAALGALTFRLEGTVSVAAIYSVALSEMSDLELRFAAQHPEATLKVEYLRPEKVYEAVLADRADLGLVSYPEATREITAIPWRREEMALVTSPYHPLAYQEAVRPEDLNGVDFIGFDDDLPIQQAVQRFLEEHNVRLRPVLHFDNIQTIKDAVMQRAGVSIMPIRVIQTELAQGRLKAVPLAGASLFRPLGIIHRKKKHFHGAGAAFLAVLQENPAPVLVGVE